MRVVWIVLLTVATTLAAVGVLLALSGIALINDANAKVRLQQSLGCGGFNCTSLAPGVDQPEGIEGTALLQVGESLLAAAAVAAFGTGALAWVDRRKRSQPSGPG